jgi:hypothetical protein
MRGKALEYARNVGPSKVRPKVIVERDNFAAGSAFLNHREVGRGSGWLGEESCELGVLSGCSKASPFQEIQTSKIGSTRSANVGFIEHSKAFADQAERSALAETLCKRDTTAHGHNRSAFWHR